MSDALWSSFQHATERHQRERSAESEADVLAAYERFCRSFVPDDAEALVAEYRDKLAKSRKAA